MMKYRGGPARSSKPSPPILAVACLLVVAVGNTAHEMWIEPPPSNRIQLQQGSELEDLILTSDNGGVRRRGGMYAALGKAGSGELIAPSSVWIEPDTLLAVAGMTVRFDDTYPSHIEEGTVEELLELPHLTGEYDAYMNPLRTTYVVVLPDLDDPADAFRVYESDGVLLILSDHVDPSQDHEARG
jgi:hypothetical protein